MKNYKVLIIAVVIIGIAVALLYSLNNGSLGGSKTLTRDEAAKLIMARLAHPAEYKAGYTTKTKIVISNARADSYSTFVNVSFASTQQLQSLKSAGFITTVQNPADTSPTFAFTDKARPYIQSYVDTGSNSTITYVMLAVPTNVNVTDLTAPSTNAGGHTVSTVGFTATFQPTPLGTILSPDTINSDMQDKYVFTLYDDGWKITN